MAKMHDYMRRRSDRDGAAEVRLDHIDDELSRLDDTIALEVATLYKMWVVKTIYTADERVQYGDKLYRCVQSHTSQADWTPDVTPALWTEVAKPGEIPVWKQPTGAQDAYMIGDKVWYPEKDTTMYVSTVDNNVWQPGVYGWEEV